MKIIDLIKVRYGCVLIKDYTLGDLNKYNIDNDNEEAEDKRNITVWVDDKFAMPINGNPAVEISFISNKKDGCIDEIKMYALFSNYPPLGLLEDLLCLDGEIDRNFFTIHDGWSIENLPEYHVVYSSLLETLTFTIVGNGGRYEFHASLKEKEGVTARDLQREISSIVRSEEESC